MFIIPDKEFLLKQKSQLAASTRGAEGANGSITSFLDSVKSR